MKLKTSAIAMAVAGTLATPMAAQADVYASARVGIENTDTAGVSDLRVRSYASRFGAQSEADLGNGLTAFGRYEWDVDLEGDLQVGGADPGIKIRHRYVGLKGDFGQVLAGQTWHTFYNTVVGPVDSPYWGSSYAFVSYTGRTDKHITYTTSVGAIGISASLGFWWEGDEDKPDNLELGATIPIGDMTLGIAMQDVEVVDDAVTGITLSGIGLGDASLAIGMQANDDDSSLAAELWMGNFGVHLETLNDDSADTDATLVTLMYNQSLGRKTTMWYEVVSYDADTGDSDDDLTAIRAVLRYDII